MNAKTTQQARPKDPLGSILVSRGLISQTDLDDALQEQKKSGQLLGVILTERGLVSREAIDDALAQQEKMETWSLDQFQLRPETVTIIPERLANRFLSLAVDRKGEELTVIMADPGDVVAIDTLRSLTGYEIKPIKGHSSEILAAIKKYYYGLSGRRDDVTLEVNLEEEEDTEIKFQADDPPVIKFVNLLMLQALERRASDVHLEPGEKDVSLRFRTDGRLASAPAPSLAMYPGVVSRIKIMARLDIAERRRPQDGRCEVKLGQKALDLRISTFPTVFGEKVVIRVLDRSGLVTDLHELGMETGQLEDFEEALHKPFGIILITGPTGSGKTTTLYAALSRLNKPDTNIVTLEDPVEYRLPGINQGQIRPEIGLNFASYLRSVLRQDPNIIMIGEMRDQETAEIAVRSALTGHLVLSTIHTNTSVATLVRLVDMGIKPYLISASLNLVVAQRLLRRLCPECRKPAPPSPLMPEGITTYGPVGCRFCARTGYWGRVGVYEVLTLTPEIRAMVLADRNESEILAQAKKDGLKTLFDSALTKVTQGLTSLEEALGTVGEEENNGEANH